MLESVLADVLTRVLGQYLKGIDRDSVHFGAWSGLVELRGVALRPEALAVLFETLGMDLPVTVEAGFIGLLRLQVPWKAIGSTPVQIHMEGVTIMARPVRGDGSDASELAQRDRRLKRAMLDTDDAVREAAWGVGVEEEEATSSWTNWLVSDELRAKIIDNVHITLSDILLRFEDPFSDPRRPYIISIVCESLKGVSANAQWMEAFVERSPNSADAVTRKLLEVNGFRVDWAPVTPRDVPGHSRGTGHGNEDAAHNFETPESLKEFMTSSGITDGEQNSASGAKSMLKPVSGSLRLCLASGLPGSSSARAAGVEKEPAVDLDIRFPDVVVDLDDVQYTCLLQTSVYFARLATRGVRPTTARGRWMWAIDQLLPGFSTRRARALQMTPKGILEARDRRLLYVAYRKSVLKARRTAVPEPKQIARDMEELEDTVSYEEVVAMRDVVDRQIELEGEDWRPATASPSNTANAGTTTSSFWHMLGYKEGREAGNAETDKVADKVANKESSSGRSGDVTESATQTQRDSDSGEAVLLRVAFVLQGATIRLSQSGFPQTSIPRVSVNLRAFRAGVLYSKAGDLTIEAVLGSVEASDVSNGSKMVYSRSDVAWEAQNDLVVAGNESSYPRDVFEAIMSIRQGSNPARDLLGDEDPESDSDEGALPGGSCFESFDDPLAGDSAVKAAGERLKARNRPRRDSDKRDSTPSSYCVTESEFLGTSTDASETQKYVAAFRYVYTCVKDKESSQQPSSRLDVSVATLEAVIDGPRGSFLWGLKFWRPKGMAQDPIMAFLGAAAGARIAELRMEIEEALAANTVPMQINAVILAPRFVIPSQGDGSPSIVVNMGTLGVCTSDNAKPQKRMTGSSEKTRVRYSNYVLTLDDLGVYLSPELSLAVSHCHSSDQLDTADSFGMGSYGRRPLDTTRIERIIRPYSVRFMLQTLRDANVVQVAHAPAGQAQSEGGENIAKVRVRGNIPGLYLVLTQSAFEHFVIEGQRWSEDLRDEGNLGSSTSSGYNAEGGWQPVHAKEDEDAKKFVGTPAMEVTTDSTQSVDDESSREGALAMASYEFRLTLQRVSVDVRNTMEARLVTAVTSRICANVVKTGKKKLQAEFTVKSWSITDGSRGSTAAFRRLLYAGLATGSSGVSPPRSLSGDGSADVDSRRGDEDFVNIRYIRDLVANEQTIQFHFLSLNLVCVRETCLKMVSFIGKVQKKAKEAKKIRNEAKSSFYASRANADSQSSQYSAAEGISRAADALPDRALSAKRTSIVSEFDGFSLHLVASGGGIALVEMKDSRVHFLKDRRGNRKAWGDFRFFSVRDWTAPVQEHVSVLTYEKADQDTDHAKAVKEGMQYASQRQLDEWTLSIPSSENDEYRLTACFGGVRLCFLYRFVEVIQQYFSALRERVKPVVEVISEDSTGSACPKNSADEHTQELSSAIGRIRVDLELIGLAIRVPRHSACSSEALATTMSSIRIDNGSEKSESANWQVRFRGVDFAVTYITPHESSPSPAGVSMPFLQGFGADIVLDLSEKGQKSDPPDLRDRPAIVRVDIPDKVLIELCEAQYTVLYFVLTENVAETITGMDMTDDPIDDEERGEVAAGSAAQHHADMQKDVGNMFPDGIKKFSNDGILPAPAVVEESTVLNVELLMSFFGVEISRGWDVSKRECKVMGLHVRNIKINFTYRTPSHLLLEFAGQLGGILDLGRPDCYRGSPFSVPLDPCSLNLSSGADAHAPRENLALTYERAYQRRPSIALAVSHIQLQTPLELTRDLTFLAIPGWPYLESSALAPEVEYLGRTMTLVVSDSQILVMAEEAEDDRRSLVIMGKFEMKVDWMRGTGAKHVSLKSTDFEVSAVSDFPHPEETPDNSQMRSFFAARFDKLQTPLVYPTSSVIQYVDPGVDEAGCRVDISLEYLLCLINTSDVALLRAVLSRPGRLRPSYLSRRDWNQASLNKQDERCIGARDSKQDRLRKARENMKLSVKIPTSRYLVSDEGEGRFVPVLEARLKSIALAAHSGSMVQMQGEIEIELFNSVMGWWEPALEACPLAASISHGQSGARAIVVKSEKRMNVNITPTTATAAATVARAFKNATLEHEPPSRDRNISSKLRASEKLKDPSIQRRPTVAAFVIRNELGLPISMTLKGSSRRSTISSNSELEVGVESEELVAPSGDGGTTCREEALKCLLLLPGYVARELSASEVGRHRFTFLPSTDADGLDSQNVIPTRRKVVHALWDVKMTNGVPLCVLRSPVRMQNCTETNIRLNISPDAHDMHAADVEDGYIFVLQPHQYFSIPVFETDWNIRVCPETPAMFEWSSPLPRISTSEVHQDCTSLRTMSSNGLPPLLSTVESAKVICKNVRASSSDFHLSLQVKSAQRPSTTSSRGIEWVDAVLRAPIIVDNKLPGPLSYRVMERAVSQSEKTTTKSQALGVVLAAGVIAAQGSTHLHFSDEKLGATFLALAYMNLTASVPSSEISSSSNVVENDMALAQFGQEISFEAFRCRHATATLPGANPSVDSTGQPRKGLRVTIAPRNEGLPRFEVSAAFWIRNRSDTALEVCSRGSYYGAGSELVTLDANPPLQDPAQYVCLEGPYVSVRVQKGAASHSEYDALDQSGWWTSSCVLSDIDKPIAVNVSDRSLQLDVRPAIGLNSSTSIITIRNSSWICNTTQSSLQWCQASSLDSHGNCRTKMLRTLSPEGAEGVHWDPKSSNRAIHLRLADENGQSDWIWSQAIPLDIGHSRVLPAKMYRPKSHEQYIARVASKELSGNSRVLVVCPEDRQNPPYRIVNLCRERAIAFSQVGSRERPWLVRAEKTSRYSWDEPLVSPNQRKLSLRIMEPDDLAARRDSRSALPSGDGAERLRHDYCELNIDVVGDRVLVLSEGYDPSVVVSVSVDGATKIVTFHEEDENGSLLSRETAPGDDGAAELNTGAVPIVGWDDVGHGAEKEKRVSGSESAVGSLSDYPVAAEHTGQARKLAGDALKVATNGAVFLHSLGISVVTSEPCELMYISLQDIHANYEAYSTVESVALHVSKFQIDNQLARTPYPVLLWIPSPEPASANNLSARSDVASSMNAVAVEIQRAITNDDIVMIKSFQAAVRAFNVCFDDDFISKTLSFLTEISVMGHIGKVEPLSGADTEKIKFAALLPRRAISEDRDSMTAPAKDRGIPSSRRIYVHDFRIHESSLRLTSSGSGAAVAKAAGIDPSARALVALVLNVEKCDFLLPPLNVQHVFDSLHHFSVLVKEYYLTQLRNQRMKLLASNALMGNPAALFDAVGTGARDFFSEPGRAKGSAEFIASVGRGSRSLFSHTVGGLVGSVSSIPRAVSSGIEKAVGDDEYVAERERIYRSNLAGGYRGGASKNPAQGLATGALSFAHGVSSGVTGFIREPVQGAKRGGAGGLLKGIGKAFLGGVAKPVAGAIDLVTEPAAGLSRQITDADASRQQQTANVAVPERPPRAFRGRNKRLSAFDSKFAVGDCLYKAVQVASGASYDSELLEWVELSDRVGRSDPDSEIWVWNVLQRYSRSMPGTKKRVRDEMRRRIGSNPGEQRAPEARPEKTMVALITMTDVLIATLDCKLVMLIPLWEDCKYHISGEGVETVLTSALLDDAPSDIPGRNASLLSGSSPLIHAPWDVSAAVKRRRPAVGEKIVYRIPCGSTAARDELCGCLKRATRMTQEVDGEPSQLFGGGDDRTATASSVELSSLSKSVNKNAHDRKRTKRDRSTLSRKIKELCDAPRSSSPSGLPVVRVVVANMLFGGESLCLRNSSMDDGLWRKDPPSSILSMDAASFEVEIFRKVSGMVSYQVRPSTENPEPELSQILVEFFDDKETLVSFATKTSDGYRVDLDGKHGGKEVTVFIVRDDVGDDGSLMTVRQHQSIDAAKQFSSISDREAETRSPGLDEANSEVSGSSREARSASGNNSMEGGRMSQDETSLQHLLDIGFNVEDSVAALSEAKGDIVRAVDILTR